MECSLCNKVYDKLRYTNKCKSCYAIEWGNKNTKYKKEYDKKYRNTKEGKKRRMIAHWKHYGLKLFGYTYEEVYEYWLETNQCEICNKDLIDNNNKCMDHCHDTGIFRAILCVSCNTYDTWEKK